MTTSDYLEQLVQDRDDLVDNLTTMGIQDLTGDETFTELVPEVLNIPSGGGADLTDYFVSPLVKTGNYSTYYMGEWFKNIKKFYVGNFPTASLKNLFWGYQGEYIEFDLNNLSNRYIYEFYSAFNTCSNLKELDLSIFTTINTAPGGYTQNTSFYKAFIACSSLTDLNMNLDLSHVNGEGESSTMGACFINCSALENLTFGYDFGKSYTSSSSTWGNLYLGDSPNLTHDSLMSVINGLYDITSKNLGFTPTVKLNATAYARLSASDIAIATNKGWNIVSA